MRDNFIDPIFESGGEMGPNDYTPPGGIMAATPAPSPMGGGYSVQGQPPPRQMVAQAQQSMNAMPQQPGMMTSMLLPRVARYQQTQYDSAMKKKRFDAVAKHLQKTEPNSPYLNLIKQGSDLGMKAYISSISKDSKSPTMTSYGTGGGMKQHGYFKPGTTNFVTMGLPTKTGGVTVNTGKVNQPMTLSDLAKVQVSDNKGGYKNAPLGSSISEISKMGGRLKPQMTAEESKQKASSEVSIKMADDLLGMIENGMDLSGFEGWAEGQRAGAGLSNIALDTALNTFGYTSDPRNVKGVAIAENLSNTVLQALRGAAVGPAEQERVDKQLPRPGQPLEVFRQNIVLTIENLKMIQSSKDKSRRAGSTKTTEPEIINWEDL